MKRDFEKFHRPVECRWTELGAVIADGLRAGHWARRLDVTHTKSKTRYRIHFERQPKAN